ncbi:hypothetical protein V5O48_006392 [Marasmius crinis-equi]|uniref:ribonuclease Z n=1 Tax=Marasmius crinis-equi TaxID=585013 RepID=A0ABR3FJN1_9AGAR
MMWNASVLSTASSDTEPSIVVTFDSFKYLFNAGENTCRSFLQSQRNWRRTKALFFTGASTERAGGLAGMLMTFADATIPRLDVVGPPGLKHFMAAMRFYTYRPAMPVNPIETPSSLPNLSSVPEPIYKDENITVYSIPVYPSKVEEGEALTTDTGKRKRSEESGDQRPAKRSNTTHESAIPSASIDEEAQAFRSSMIDTMFPASPGGRDIEYTQKAKRGKRKREQLTKETKAPIATDSSKANFDEYRRPSVPQGFYSQLPKFTQTPIGSSYLIVGPRVRGKFDADKAKELGIPQGKLRAQLIKGETITFTAKVDDGVDEQGKKKTKEVTRTVKPEEIVGQSDAPGAVLILDVPTPAHIPSLTEPFANSTFFKRFRSNAREDNTEFAVRSVFHICGNGVLDDERYKAFMNGFCDSTHHIVASRQHSPDPVTFTSAAYNQLRLSQLDSEIFRVPSFSLTPKRDLACVQGLPSNVHQLVANQHMSIRPPGEPTVETEGVDRFHPIVMSSEGISLSEDTLSRFEEAKKRVADMAREKENSNDPKCPGADVRIISLGTGSATPSKYRNVSGTLIMIPNYGNILLDCGEGTWGQLCRHFGTDEGKEENVQKVLRDLRVVYISHIHGDHHMGVANLLRKRKQLTPEPSEPLYLVSIRALHLYLRELSDLQDMGISDDPSKNGVMTILSPSLHWRDFPSYPESGLWQVGGNEPWLDIELSREKARAMCEKLGLKSFKTVDVRHRTRCYGAVICHKDGWSIVYSGDTMPSDSLVYASPSATVLIHEATMADDQEELAAKKAHSTIGQALDIGRRMKARNILLTHFSARYPKIITYKSKQWHSDQGTEEEKVEEITGFDPDEGVVAIAFDHADMKIGDMWKINYYLPALQSSFQQTVAEDGEDEELEEATMQVDTM